MLSDTDAKWSESMGLSVDLSAVGFGTRTARYAMIIDNLVVKYVEVRYDTCCQSCSLTLSHLYM